MAKKLIFSALVIFLGVYFYNFLYSPPPLPKIEDIVWKKSKNPNDDAITPFSINVPQQALDGLKQRLQSATYFPPLQGVNFQYGFDTEHLKKIVEYWATKYNWREREKVLNSVPQYRTQISGLDIHFIRYKPDPKLIGKKRVLPLLLLHGWPGSVKEFYGVFPLLTSPKKEYDFVFEVVAPSLPGYGFSEAAAISGMNTAQIGSVMNKLMNRLGFKKFYVQGGDWGSLIGSDMATLFPENVIGYHSNMCSAGWSPVPTLKLIFGNFFPDLIAHSQFKDKLYPLRNFMKHLMIESGYLHLQATKPNTVGVALHDSPVGLAAYILEKFSTWTNTDWRDLPDGGLKIQKSAESKYSVDDLLDNVMIYWASNSITSSMRLYAETFNSQYQNMQLDKIPINVPTVCAHYPHDLVYTPETILNCKYKNLVHVSHMPRGGHFAAFEEPVLFSNDVWMGICKIENLIHNTTNTC